MRKYLWLMLMILAYNTVILHAVEDEPSELNWESFGCNIDVFKNFQSYWSKNPLSGATFEECPTAFPVVTVRPDAFATNLGNWKIAKSGKTEVIEAKYGHAKATTRAELQIKETGLYRVWVKYYHMKGYSNSFSLRILPPELLKQTDPSIVSSKGEYYANKFAWNEHRSKRPQPLPNQQNMPTGFMWESGPLVELASGDYTLELSTLIHGGPFTARKIAMVVLTADPLLTNIDSVVNSNSYPASNLTKQAWNTWIQRPGALPWEKLNADQRKYYLNWRSSFLQKLAENPETDAEKRLATQSVFDETLNLIGTPADIAKEKKQLADDLKNYAPETVTIEIEAENLTASNGWNVDDHKEASARKMLNASYSNGPATAATSIKLPKAGKYYAWVRYFIYHKYYSLFDLSFTNEQGEKVATANYGDPQDRLKRKNYQFTWECIPVDLPAGTLELSLNKDIGKAPYTFRKVDKIFITDSQFATPDKFYLAASNEPTTIWIQQDPWRAFSRFSIPDEDDSIEPQKIDLQISKGDVSTLLLHYRNDTTNPITLVPKFSGNDTPLLRLVSYMNTSLYSWTPVVLLERSEITVPPLQNASLWLTFSTKSLPEGKYNSVLALGDRKIDFNITVTPSNNTREVPIVGGWCSPLERTSCWELFSDIGINLVNSIVIPKDEMTKYGIKQFCITANGFEEDVLKARQADLRAIGLKEQDWSLFLIDEPKASHLPKWLEMAQKVRSITPEVQIWCNPGEIQSSTPDTVRKMSSYIDVFCPFVDHFRSKDEKYSKEESPAIGKLKLIYTTPCFREKSPDSPQDLLELGELATEYNREGWAPFSLFCSYTYSNSVWDEMYPFDSCQSVSFYPGAYGRTLSTRNMEAMREAIQRYRK